jgi:hypothetical protein
MLLKHEFPEIICYGYGTPASVVDARTSVEIASYVTSIVLGNDLVSRLNFLSLCKLRNDILDAIARAKVNKMVIMRAILMTGLSPEDVMYPRGEEPESTFKVAVTKFKVIIIIIIIVTIDCH